MQPYVEAIKKRNGLWIDNKYIPSWVDTNTVGLDQFFTRPDIAQYCYDSLHSFIESKNKNINQYKFIEPSAGKGAFYNILPTKKRIGIDIMPMIPGIIEKDFLSWQPPVNGHRYIIIGNPPFGYRAWLALAFMNHASGFADYVGCILPMSFQSEGKGSPKYRVNGLRLLHTERLPQDSFTDSLGSPVKINALWQIWESGENKRTVLKKCSQWMELFTVDMRKERLCGQKKLHKADLFLQRTFYKDPPSPVFDFSEVKYVCGYGIIIKKDKENIKKLLFDTDWLKYNNLAAHNCHHISMCHINKALTDAGYVDD